MNGILDNLRKKPRDCSTGKPVKVSWTKIWHVAFTKPDQGQEIVMLFKYCLDQPFQAAIIGALPRQSRNSLNSDQLKIPLLYNGEILVRKTLKKDLLHLCRINAIDAQYHN